MSDLVNLNKVGACESCSQVKPLFEAPHTQDGNDHVWEYCENCAFTSEVEKGVQVKLVELQAIDPQKANDPVEVAKIRVEVAKILKAEDK